MENEIWRDIPEYEGIYQASSYGRIRRVGKRADAWLTPGMRDETRWRALTPERDQSNYQRVVLSKEAVRKKVFVHVLVAAAFLGPCPDGCVRNHKNGDQADNRPENLEYVTPGENELHSYRILGKRPPQQGSRHWQHKLTEQDIPTIRTLSAAGVSGVALAHRFNVSEATISEVINNRHWTHV